MESRLYRDEQNKVLGGVCAGLAEYFNLDIMVVRLIFLFALIVAGSGFMLYIILWIVIPRNHNVPGVDYIVPPEGTSETYPYQQPRRVNSGSMIGGLILILFGAYFLLEQFDFLPDWDFDKLWPVILIIIGLVIIFGRRRRPAPADTLNHPTNTNL
jgi:phage shock protein C